MNRFHCRAGAITGTRIIIDDREQLHHLKVLRLEPGEEAVVFDENGNEYFSTITAVEKERAILEVIRKARPAGKNAVICVAVAIPKKSKIDDVIDKLTQVGVDRIIPMVTERTIVRPDERDAQARHKRWEKIAEAATLQSQRNSFPRVDPLVRFPRLLEQSGEFDLKLIPTLEGDRKCLRDAVRAGTPKSILVLIGPEGDFSPSETARAKSAGFVPVSFGANVLRVETAAVYVASILAYEFR